MTGGPAGPGTRSWAEDWMAIWQSEMRAMATDREMAEIAASLAASWAEGAAAAMAAVAMFVPAPSRADPTPEASGPDPSHPVAPATDGPARRTGTGAPAGTASAMVAPDAGNAPRRDAEQHIANLVRRVGELERRLAGLEPERD